MAYAAFSVVFGEQPSAAKWNILGSNDASFNDGTGIANMATSTTSISNPYKFRVSRNAAANIGNGAFLKITYDTEQYDTNSNFSGGTYTVPVSGYYQFNWSLSATMSSGADELLTTAIFKNGVEYSRGSTINYRNAEGVSGSDIIQLAAGNTVEIQAFGTVGRAIGVGASTCYFSGYLVSQT